jgi:hypothetical protein
MISTQKKLVFVIIVISLFLYRITVTQSISVGRSIYIINVVFQLFGDNNSSCNIEFPILGETSNISNITPNELDCVLEI